MKATEREAIRFAILDLEGFIEAVENDDSLALAALLDGAKKTVEELRKEFCCYPHDVMQED